MNRVNDKVAIVTGAARGIGRATCLLLAKEGAVAVVTDVVEARGNDVVEEIRTHGGKAAFWRLDVTDEMDVQQVFAAVHGRFGKIDVLVNNAGIAGVNKPTHMITEEAWDMVMGVNVKGVFLCTKHAIPYMLKNGSGSIVNLSSIYGLVGGPDLPPYHASKGAVRLMTKTDALLYAKAKIRVNSVHPGFIWTPLVEELGRNSPVGPAGYREQLDDIPALGHVGEPDDIAYGILYLASDESKFVTGTELVIDGGFTCR
jgi:NAD(P)-dependent dehydrogenase (short-subunit alcohol dehydrogenase family)